MTARHLSLIPLLPLLSIFIWRQDLPIFGHTFGPRYQLFEIFVFLVSVALTADAAFTLHKRRDSRIADLLPTIVFTVLGLYFVAQTFEYHPKSYDWFLREGAAKAIVGGESPYVIPEYLYPPLTAQALATVYRASAWGASLAGIPPDPQLLWDLVFFLYQTAQFFLIMLAYLLCFQLAREIGVDGLTTAILLSVLFVFCTPLFRTIRHHQVNLWLLDSILVALLTYRRFPSVCGFALALGAHIKLYPLILLLPLLGMKQLKPFLWFLVAFLGIFLLQTSWGTDLRFWREFTDLMAAFPHTNVFRDNGAYSLIHNSFHLTNRLLAIPENFVASGVKIAVWIARLAATAWFAVRFVQRERSYAGTTGIDRDWAALSRSMGHLLDAIPFILIVSPIVFEHHYVLAIPFILWVIVTRGAQRPWPVGIATFLVLAVPAFDVFPLSYHRLAGLLLLVCCSPPLIFERVLVSFSRPCPPSGALRETP